MDCRTAESLVMKYIRHTLTLDELEEFLSHVQNCPACYEELETYFTVSTAMQHLDGGIDERFESSMDMHKLLEQDLKRSENYVHHCRLRRRLMTFLLSLAVCALFAVIIWLFL